MQGYAMQFRLPVLTALPCLLAALAACGGTATPGAASGTPAAGAPAATATACLPGERGFLEARLKGEIDTSLQWHGQALECEGGARPEGRGLRVSFLGHDQTTGQALRFVFGMSATPGSASSRNVPAHLTVLAEGSARAWATQGDGQCMIETLVQERLPTTASAATAIAGEGATSDWRIAARGFCIDPAVTLDGAGRLWAERFDFAGIARFEEDELHE
jgi:hypothetical protein